MNIKAVVGYEGRYEVSDNGKVFSIYRKVKSSRHKSGFLTVREKELKRSRNFDSYLTIDLCKDGRCKKVRVHRLVTEAFISNPDNKPEVNHKDGDHENNNVDNLEWATDSEQQIHAYKIGLRSPKKGEENGRAKLTNKEVLMILETKDKSEYSQRKLAKMFNISQRTIWRILNKKSWSHVEI